MMKRYLSFIFFVALSGSTLAQDMPPLPGAAGAPSDLPGLPGGSSPAPAAPAPGGDMPGLPGLPGGSSPAPSASAPGGDMPGLPGLPGGSSPAPSGDASGLPALPGNSAPAASNGLPALPGDAAPAAGMPALPGDAAPAAGMPALPGETAPTAAPAPAPAEAAPAEAAPAEAAPAAETKPVEEAKPAYQQSKTRPKVIFGGWINAKGGNITSKLSWVSQEILNVMDRAHWKMIKEEGVYQGEENKGPQSRTFTFGVPGSKEATVEVYLKQVGKKVWLRVGPPEEPAPADHTLTQSERIRANNQKVMNILKAKFKGRLGPHHYVPDWTAPYDHQKGTADE